MMRNLVSYEIDAIKTFSKTIFHYDIMEGAWPSTTHTKALHWCEEHFGPDAWMEIASQVALQEENLQDWSNISTKSIWTWFDNHVYFKHLSDSILFKLQWG